MDRLSIPVGLCPELLHSSSSLRENYLTTGYPYEESITESASTSTTSSDEISSSRFSEQSSDLESETGGSLNHFPNLSYKLTPTGLDSHINDLEDASSNLKENEEFKKSTKNQCNSKIPSVLSIKERFWAEPCKTVQSQCHNLKIKKSDNYLVKFARPEDIDTFTAWRNGEFNYSVNPDYIRAIYEAYDHQCLILVVDPETGSYIGSINAVRLNDQIACGGMFGVLKTHQRMGIGTQLWNIRKDFLGHDCVLSVNAVNSRIPANIKLGLHTSFKSRMYSGFVTQDALDRAIKYLDEICVSQNKNTNFLNPKNVQSIILKTHITSTPKNGIENTLPEQLVTSILAYDTSVHIIPRGSFIRHLIMTHKNVISVIAIDNLTERVVGYGILRPRAGEKMMIAPLLADNSHIAALILRSLLTELKHLYNSKVGQAADNITEPTPPSNMLTMSAISLGMLALDDSPENVPVKQLITPTFTSELMTRQTFVSELFKILGMCTELELTRMYSGKGLPFTLNFDKCYFITASECFLL